MSMALVEVGVNYVLKWAEVEDTWAWLLWKVDAYSPPPLDTRRYLPLVGHTDGKLEVLELLSWKTTFYTDAHCPSPVLAIASTWNSIVTSGQYCPSLTLQGRSCRD